MFCHCGLSHQTDKDKSYWVEVVGAPTLDPFPNVLDPNCKGEAKQKAATARRHREIRENAGQCLIDTAAALYPWARGFVYLAVVLDWFSRRVLAWRVSITLEVEFCLGAVEEALARHSKPDIFITDQGSKSTSGEFTGLLLDNAIAFIMHGRGACATTSSSSGSGAPSSIRRSTCAPMTASEAQADRRVGI